MYTRRGDRGETSLFGTTRVPKDSKVIEALGDIDELNSCLGVAVSKSTCLVITDALKQVQRTLTVAGIDLAASYPSARGADTLARTTRNHTNEIERKNRELHVVLPKLRGVLIRRGNELACQLYLATALCKRTAREIEQLGHDARFNPEIIRFFNRLTLLLFDLARYANVVDGVKEEIWA
jgi:cob(I)alamin adenosyltransferase